ncbi:GNAT family N-acetyltransferase [Afifella pfennigii]|uniref:GNAT family N-acetyltransferase n=1 Tax=Afifella pfennigii TaxID=209897 RepID=UPI00047AA820|nr:N-acetyltransferase [Afifella pfennigii]
MDAATQGLEIREAGEADRAAVLNIERRAFAQPEEAELVADLLADPTAEPRLSLLALFDGEPVGHILFTAAELEGAGRRVKAAILAPLAVLPKAQGKGCGGALIREGLKRLQAEGVELVFVLGHADYYPRHGFVPALPHGLEAPHPIPPEHHDAWMVQALKEDVLGMLRGTVRPAKTLARPELWREDEEPA